MAEERNDSRWRAFSRWLDAAISKALREKKRQQSARGCLRIIITGSESESLSGSLRSLDALYHAGYRLRIVFSYSASQSVVKAGCLRWNLERQGAAEIDNLGPREEEAFTAVFLPSLSLNSLIKIASGLRDNIACDWVFYALGRQKQVIATLGSECTAKWHPPALRALIARHITTLQQYGVVIAGNSAASVSARGQSKKLIALRDVRRMAAGEKLYLDRNTLITPAARDELRHRDITIIQGS